MALLPQVFDASLIDPSTPFEPVPAGTYTAQIVASDMRATRDGMGQYLQLDIVIAEGPQAGRRIIERLNLVNRSTQAMEIANRTLSAICRATGQMRIEESSALHGIAFVLEVTVKLKGGLFDAYELRYRRLGGASQLPKRGASPATDQVFAAPILASGPVPPAPSFTPPAEALVARAASLTPWKQHTLAQITAQH